AQADVVYGILLTREHLVHTRRLAKEVRLVRVAGGIGRKSLPRLAIFGCIVLLLFLQMAAAEVQGVKAFTVRDSIELVRFDDQSAEVTEQVHFAPDGRTFFVVNK